MNTNSSTRRSFLKTTTVGAAIAATGPISVLAQRRQLAVAPIPVRTKIQSAPSRWLEPQVSLMPVLMNAVQNPGNDPLAQQVGRELGPLKQVITQRWNTMPAEEKARRYHTNAVPAVPGDL